MGVSLLLRQSVEFETLGWCEEYEGENWLGKWQWAAKWAEKNAREKQNLCMEKESSKRKHELGDAIKFKRPYLT